MRRVLAAMFCIGSLHGAHAAPFADPTRPPGKVEAGTDGAGERSGPRLESVLIAPDRRIAVINGQQVVVGARVAGGEVVRISEGEVLIRGAEGVQTLQLVPDVRRPAEARKKGTAP